MLHKQVRTILACNSQDRHVEGHLTKHYVANLIYASDPAKCGKMRFRSFVSFLLYVDGISLHSEWVTRVSHTHLRNVNRIARRDRIEDLLLYAAKNRVVVSDYHEGTSYQDALTTRVMCIETPPCVGAVLGMPRPSARQYKILH